MNQVKVEKVIESLMYKKNVSIINMLYGKSDKFNLHLE